MLQREAHYGKEYVVASETTGPGASGKKPRKSLSSLELELGGWQHFYGDLGMEINYHGMKIPRRQPEFERLLIVPEGMSVMNFVQLMRTEVSAVWLSELDLNALVKKHERKPSKTYAVWTTDVQKAFGASSGDEVLDNANGLGTITLLECLIHQTKYYHEARHYLGEEGIPILCSGSRTPDGSVPVVHWVNNNFFIWICKKGSIENYSTRHVVF